MVFLELNFIHLWVLAEKNSRWPILIWYGRKNKHSPVINFTIFWWSNFLSKEASLIASFFRSESFDSNLLTATPSPVISLVPWYTTANPPSATFIRIKIWSQNKNYWNQSTVFWGKKIKIYKLCNFSIWKIWKNPPNSEV